MKNVTVIALEAFISLSKKNDCIETKVKLFPDSSVPCYLHLLKKNAKICFSILSAIYLLPFVSLSCIQSKFYFY